MFANFCLPWHSFLIDFRLPLGRLIVVRSRGRRLVHQFFKVAFSGNIHVQEVDVCLSGSDLSQNATQCARGAHEVQVLPVWRPSFG